MPNFKTLFPKQFSKNFFGVYQTFVPYLITWHYKTLFSDFDYLISQNFNFMFDISLFRVWRKCLLLETLVIDTKNPVCLISISIVHTFDCLLSFPLEIPALGSLPTNKSSLILYARNFPVWLAARILQTTSLYDWLNFKHFLGYQIWVKLIYRLTKSEDLVLTSIFTLQAFLQLCTFTNIREHFIC